ncbi:MAG: ABC transporter substrate-binding protein, partial [Anaerolineae bacterium]|nr:ABC transporter substrate-binding protein [Anaerolineae bacterium]
LHYGRWLSYVFWLTGETEISGIPPHELQSHLQQFSDEIDQVFSLDVYYFGFSADKPPFDDRRVRAAFSAAFDRATYIQEVLQGQGLPMQHFAPPGIFGAPPIDEVGIGYDPAWARQQLAEAGYPNCEGFPEVTLLGYYGHETLSLIEYAKDEWMNILGCTRNQIFIKQQSFADLLVATSASTPIQDRPHIWTLTWSPEYADENNWVGDVLWCGSDSRIARPCTSLDELIVDARAEPDPAARILMYRQIEEGFFGEDGEFPLAPLYVGAPFIARHAWLERLPALFGGQHWYAWTIDEHLRLSMLE